MRKILAMVAFTFAFQMLASAANEAINDVGKVVLQQATATATQAVITQGPSLVTQVADEVRPAVVAVVRAASPSAKKRAQSPGTRIKLGEMQDRATTKVTQQAEVVAAAQAAAASEAAAEEQPQPNGDDDKATSTGCFCIGRPRSGGLPNSLSFRSQGSKESATPKADRA